MSILFGPEIHSFSTAEDLVSCIPGGIPSDCTRAHTQKKENEIDSPYGFVQWGSEQTETGLYNYRPAKPN